MEHATREAIFATRQPLDLHPFAFQLVNDFHQSVGKPIRVWAIDRRSAEASARRYFFGPTP